MKRISIWIFKRLLLILIVQSITLYFYTNIIGWNLYSKEVSFEKDGHQVILLGVSHIAESYYYELLNKRYKNINNMIVLTEGLSDENETSEGFDHRYSAEVFGLDYQKKSFMKGYYFKNSDMDINDIEDKYLITLSKIFSIWKNLAFLNFKEVKIDMLSMEDISLKDMYNEIIINRNDKLKYEIKNNKSNLLIPWGAIHHLDLENFLKEEGYEKKSTSYIKTANILSMIINLGGHFLK